MISSTLMNVNTQFSYFPFDKKREKTVEARIMFAIMANELFVFLYLTDPFRITPRPPRGGGPLWPENVSIYLT